MQNCFREYPEVYGSELESDAADDEDDMPSPAAPAHAQSERPSPTQPESVPKAAYADSSPAPAPQKPAPTGIAAAEKGNRTLEPTSQPPPGSERPNLGLVPDDYKPETGVKSQEPTSESERLVPKGAHDAGERGTEKLERK